MSDSRVRSPTASDEESNHPSRNVRARWTSLPGDPYLQHADQMDESDPEEEPFEEEAAPLSSSPSTPLLDPTPVASPTPDAPPVPSQPSISTCPVHNTPPPAALHWDWMPDILDWWRRDEQIPILPPITEPPTPIPPMTREAAHETVPVLITRLRSHERIIQWLEEKVKNGTGAPAHELEELHQQVLGVESELMELKDEVVDTHIRATQARDEAVVLRQEQDETRQRVAALEEAVAALRTERDQFRADAESSARFCGIMGDMAELLR